MSEDLIKHLRARIQELEAALRDVINYLPAAKRHNLKRHIRITMEKETPNGQVP